MKKLLLAIALLLVSPQVGYSETDFNINGNQSFKVRSNNAELRVRNKNVNGRVDIPTIDNKKIRIQSNSYGKRRNISIRSPLGTVRFNIK